MTTSEIWFQYCDKCSRSFAANYSTCIYCSGRLRAVTKWTETAKKTIPSSGPEPRIIDLPAEWIKCDHCSKRFNANYQGVWGNTKAKEKSFCSQNCAGLVEIIPA